MKNLFFIMICLTALKTSVASDCLLNQKKLFSCSGESEKTYIFCQSTLHGFYSITTSSEVYSNQLKIYGVDHDNGEILITGKNIMNEEVMIKVPSIIHNNNYSFFININIFWNGRLQNSLPLSCKK